MIVKRSGIPHLAFICWLVGHQKKRRILRSFRWTDTTVCARCGKGKILTDLRMGPADIEQEFRQVAEGPQPVEVVKKLY